MIEIDGSYGEGGGQILRTAVSLSALTMRPVRVFNIRAGRPKPGLKNQHIAGIEITGKIVDAEIKGLQVGSTVVEFVPRQRRGGTISYDVGTAGSISLVLQAALPPAVLSSEPISFKLRGGTDVKWSPPIDYLNNVFVHTLEILGPKIQILQRKRGHFPRGGGNVICEVTPVDSIKPLEGTQFGNISSVGGISHCVRLPEHIAERQAASAGEIIIKHLEVEPDIARESYSREEDPHLGPGSGIVIWAQSERGFRMGADELGERGKSAESVGVDAASQLVAEVSTGKAIDSHLCDMLIPYLAMAKGTSKIGVAMVTSHLTTNIWAVKKVLGTRIDVQGRTGEPGTVLVEGRGLSL
ncbi:MAG: RNA 3'-phosphate cyclase [Candidatus Thorarchaeota archaeon SMTZ-45]|nr:MAG: RNA 3'-phosphate cyclase [Candidatus Thorarchaeota archaeon SMTZ-45]KXH75506.1 MAG: RNA 3'-phosphate cyclase [Candidatus Thorarchaeota archaeon SMTZ1-45]